MSNYECIFNFQHEITKLNVEARDKVGAWLNCCYALGKKYGKTKRSMQNYFNGRQDNYEIHGRT